MSLKIIRNDEPAIVKDFGSDDFIDKTNALPKIRQADVNAGCDRPEKQWFTALPQ